LTINDVKIIENMIILLFNIFLIKTIRINFLFIHTVISFYIYYKIPTHKRQTTIKHED